MAIYLLSSSTAFVVILNHPSYNKLYMYLEKCILKIIKKYTTAKST
jgi:hypothetical protein